jgi:hypothetical protein
VDEHIDIARTPSECPHVPLTAQSQSLSVVDPGWDVDIEGSLLGDPAGPAAD